MLATSLIGNSSSSWTKRAEISSRVLRIIDDFFQIRIVFSSVNGRNDQLICALVYVGHDVGIDLMTRSDDGEIEPTWAHVIVVRTYTHARTHAHWARAVSVLTSETIETNDSYRSGGYRATSACGVRLGTSRYTISCCADGWMLRRGRRFKRAQSHCTNAFRI